MALDTNIPLQVRTPDIGGGLLQFVQLKNAKEDRERKNKLVDLQTKEADLKLKDYEAGAGTRALESFNERETSRIKSIVLAASQFKPLLDAGNNEGARTIATQRREALEKARQQGVEIDTTETDEFLQALDTDPERAKAMVNQTLQLGQRLGFLKKEEVQEKFEPVVDAQGNTIAQKSTTTGKVIEDPRAPKARESKLLTPEEEAQQTRLKKAGANKIEIDLTPGQKSADQAFGKEYTDFVAGGGFADIKKNLNQLKQVRAELESGESLTGPVTGSTPDWMRKFTNAKSLAARDAVEEVVQRNLRLILGAQFTEREGERLIKRSYNENLSEKENVKRLNRLIGQIETAAKAKQEAVNYFDQNGTLKGFKGKIFSAADFLNDSVPTEEPASPEKVEELLKKYGPTR